MKPIADWTDDELRWHVEADEHSLYAEQGLLAAEVLRLRGEMRVRENATEAVRWWATEQVARAEKAEALLARYRPVIDAAVAWAERPPWSPDASETALIAAVDALQNEETP